MKPTLALVLLVFGSFGAFAEEDLPPVLYCAIGASQAEFHFNDNGEHWFRFTHIDGTQIFKGLLKKRVIKNLKADDGDIFFKQRAGSAGQVWVSINRKTGGITSSTGSGNCSLEKPSEQRKF